MLVPGGRRPLAVRFICGLVEWLHRDSPRFACARLSGCGQMRCRVRMVSACGSA